MIFDETSERVEAAVDMDDKQTEILDFIYDEVTEVSYAEYADVVIEYLNFNLNLNLASRWARRRFT